MGQSLIVYGSTTGNTEFVAKYMADFLNRKGIESETRDVARTTVSKLDSSDLVLLGCSSWGEEDVGLQEDFEPFYNQLESIDFTGRRFVLFGCGDSGYKHFCGAVDTIEKTLKMNGAQIVYPSLKIDGEPEAALGQIEAWLTELVVAIR